MLGWFALGTLVLNLVLGFFSTAGLAQVQTPVDVTLNPAINFSTSSQEGYADAVNAQYGLGLSSFWDAACMILGALDVGWIVNYGIDPMIAFIIGKIMLLFWVLELKAFLWGGRSAV